MLRLAELWSSHLGRVERREWDALHAQLRERVAADHLPDLLVTLEHPHAEGRLLGYVIMRDDASDDAPRVQEAVVSALAELGVQPQPKVDSTAIWVRDRKIGSLAGHDRFAIGVDHPLPTGTTTVRREAGRAVSLRDVRRTLTRNLARAHAREGLEVAPEWLGQPAR
jgi:hypothetical protein